MKNTSAIMALLVISVSCSKEMDRRTEKMEKRLEQVSSAAEAIKEKTALMSSSDAGKTRADNYNLLMEEKSPLRTKMSAACNYFKNFEYQSSTDSELQIDEHSRNSLYLLAVDEFMARAGDLYDQIRPKKMNPLDQNKSRNNDIAFYALAACLHVNHHFQNEIITGSSPLQTNSMYGIMKTALKKELVTNDLENHEQFIVNGINKEITLELIKARVDVMSVLALKNLTDERNMTIGQKSKAAIFKITGGRLGSIDYPEVYENSNKSTREFTSSYLMEALRAKQFLSELGVEKKLHKKLKSALKNIDFNEKKKGKEYKDTVKDQQKESIKNLIDNLVD